MWGQASFVTGFLSSWTSTVNLGLPSWLQAHRHVSRPARKDESMGKQLVFQEMLGCLQQKTSPKSLFSCSHLLNMFWPFSACPIFGHECGCGRLPVILCHDLSFFVGGWSWHLAATCTKRAQDASLRSCITCRDLKTCFLRRDFCKRVLCLMCRRRLTPIHTDWTLIWLAFGSFYHRVEALVKGPTCLHADQQGLHQFMLVVVAQRLGVLRYTCSRLDVGINDCDSSPQAIVSNLFVSWTHKRL